MKFSKQVFVCSFNSKIKLKKIISSSFFALKDRQNINQNKRKKDK